MKKIKLSEGDRVCPKCGSNWDGGSILETFVAQREQGSSMWEGKTDDEIEVYIKDHYSPPYRWEREIGIEILGGYDGVSYWRCPDCNTDFDRWTGDEKIWPKSDKN